jgi:hypothetical protein
MREFLNKHGKYVAIAAILLAVVIYFVFGRGPGEPNIQKAFFVDDETGETFTLGLSEGFAPRNNPNTGKPTLVQVVKYSCDGGTTSKDAYYVKYSDGVKKQLDENFAKTGKIAGIDVSLGTWVRSPAKGSKWLQGGSTESAQVMSIKCPSGEISWVLP